MGGLRVCEDEGEDEGRGSVWRKATQSRQAGQR